MKTRLALVASCALALAPLSALRAENEPEAPVPVTLAPSAPQAEAPRSENQRLYGPSGATIIPADQARALIEKFKDTYAKLGNPRILFFINRDLVDSSSGLKLSGRTEKYEDSTSTRKSDVERMGAPAAASPQTQVNVSVNGSTGTDSQARLPQGKAEVQSQSSKTSGENSYTVKEAAKATLADRQTAREVERLFGRAFRAAGAALADQKVAADMMSDKPHGNLSGLNDQAAKDREALGSIADVVIEILVSSRTITIPAVSGDQQLLMPDVQATAIRLKDAAILGQAASSDILGKDRHAGPMLQQYDIRDITEATALALMEDMTSSAK